MKKNASIIVLKSNFWDILVGNGVIKLESERVAALNDLQQPTTKKELQRILVCLVITQNGFLIILPLYERLFKLDFFSLSKDASNAFHVIKNKLSQATLQPIHRDLPFTVETDASDFAIAATLNQNSKPVAFHARTQSDPKVTPYSKITIIYSNAVICFSIFVCMLLNVWQLNLCSCFLFSWY